ncbi:MAG: ASCH domain-containing protein [Clostridia bacterium]|nr:ASCH domain-containing protein [Clostridia bacterium]MDD4375816.1 ASCH domain-containing protein [Clostridia bacterium]
MKKHTLRIKKEYFNLINKGIKTLEVRVGYFQIKRIKSGDLITFENYGQNLFNVVRVTVYPDFEEMLDTENSKLVIPNKTKYQAYDMLHAIYPEDREQLGVYVIELKKV